MNYKVEAAVKEFVKFELSKPCYTNEKHFFVIYATLKSNNNL